MATITTHSRQARRGWPLELLRMPHGGTMAERPAHGEEVRPPTDHDSSQDAMETRVVKVSGDLSDARAVQDLHRCCLALLNPRRRRVVLDLGGVRRADTKLVAGLVSLARRARSACVRLEIRPSAQVRKWIVLCKMNHLLAKA